MELSIKLSNVFRDTKRWISLAKFYGAGDYAEDIVQDSYILCYDYFSKKDKECDESKLQGFAYLTIRNATIDYVRKSKNMPCVDILDYQISYENTSEEDIYQTILEDQAIHDTLKELQTFDKLLFEHYFDLNRRGTKKSMREIADESRIALRTIFNSINETKSKIKTKIENGKETKR